MVGIAIFMFLCIMAEILMLWAGMYEEIKKIRKILETKL